MEGRNRQNGLHGLVRAANHPVSPFPVQSLFCYLLMSSKYFLEKKSENQAACNLGEDVWLQHRNPTESRETDRGDGENLTFHQASRKYSRALKNPR